MEKLLEIAKEILKENPKCLLSGSLAINLQGFKTRREPSDIDLWFPKIDGFKKLEGMVFDTSSTHYEEIDHHRDSFMLGETKIDVFFPHWAVDPRVGRVIKNGIQMVPMEKILNFKMEHALDQYYEDVENKHALDIIFILEQLINRTFTTL